jgi:hypothetical protein
MADDKAKEPGAEGTSPGRPGLPEWSRDASGTEDGAAGFIIVGGLPMEGGSVPPDDADEPGDEAGPDEIRKSSPDYASMGLGSQLLRLAQTGRSVPREVIDRARARCGLPPLNRPTPPDRSTEPPRPEDPSE